MDLLRRRVALSLAAFADGGFVQLAVVSPHLLEQIPRPVGYRKRMLADATRIDQV